MSAPTSRPRPMGGFNSGFSNFSDEHLDENAFQAAAQQQQQAAQATQLTPAQMQQAAQQAQAQQALEAGAGGMPPGMDGMPGAGPAAPPRELGSLTEELVTRPLQDIGRELKSFFDLNQILGISNPTDSAQTLAKKKQMIQAYNRLNSEQQQYAQQLYQKRLREKQQAEQMEQQRRQAEAQQGQSFSVPSGPKKGPVGPSGSKKQKAVTQLQQNRKTLSGPSNVN